MSTDKNTFKTINPATEETIATYNYASSDDAKKKVEDCHNAFLDWKLKPLEERAEILKSIGKTLEKHKESYAQLMTQEMGKLLSHSYQEIDLCISICEYTATEGLKQLQDQERSLFDGGKGTIHYSPIGVVYGIQPWNFPLYQPIRYSIASLMAGNGVLLKHAKNVTGCALKLKEIYEEAGLPKNLFQVLVINHSVSDDIIENQYVKGVTLTGSTPAGKHVAVKAAEVIKKTVLELGSNDAYIVLDDADISKAAKICANARIYNNGQTCIAAKRFIVVDSVYDEFKKEFVNIMQNMSYGDPTNNDNDLGPIARKDLREQLHNKVEESVENGAEILCGGKIPDTNGYYYPSTVLGNVTPGQPAYSQELFGPVASLIKAKDNTDAMRIANDSKFGLGGGIFSENEDKAMDLAKNYFDTGMIHINSYGLAYPNMPFGGVKNSGYGREHGGFGIKEFVNAKAITQA
ncbi:NAD-dependent succinate-semialdehyde dehydrogenase [Cellulophaga lytica]|uniref:Succinate-semialdehyde dehydrogenase (NAD(P)(+)) n=1 Tax=Cellulophaga lytica (strain ATCC 23178 / DSM 7489 / JCM 8516 / NBRC 14961 / NCIMB 1423 / VKM B-1433 / Cy l20) TaxID=867900 RepID=F0RI14_CELLC|nr:NAD-dependent succinate-semialdehyde dehydrogenase [Cellulophaga lytica]ADY30295.1 Succinate-semialdehyde dehydrogenase (NAD(P)(+)) [Cellulophaga lytica DSM 7489]AIM61283.1 succinate-semialdehyde dehydrogenase [Cellulophaga lytica]APU11188.1 succinate-semialdehyde dehydrogenase [Cellulophaga lytica]WQG78771.1 NAD-dependent succinate-semialdehyde dehydrogenase [Cellulophaga lytica]